MTVNKLKDDNDMTVDTSREAVEALIRQQARASCGIGANDPMMLIFTLRALLDERDAARERAEADLHIEMAELFDTQAERDKLAKKLDAIKKLHMPIIDPWRDEICEECELAWPCDTAIILADNDEPKASE